MFDALKKRLARVARGRKLNALERFARHEEGAAAVEFAMVAIPFLGLMFAIMETALVFFAGQTLETAVADSARKVMTGQAKAWTPDKFKEEVCSHVFGLFDCNKIQVNVKAYPSFSAAEMKAPIDDNGNIVSSFNAGGPGDVVIARLLYDWPTFIPALGLSNRPDNKRLLVATAAFRNEPYQ
jgi:Flp pilus assembly protein TadG